MIKRKVKQVRVIISTNHRMAIKITRKMTEQTWYKLRLGVIVWRYALSFDFTRTCLISHVIIWLYSA